MTPARNRVKRTLRADCFYGAAADARVVDAEEAAVIANAGGLGNAEGIVEHHFVAHGFERCDDGGGHRALDVEHVGSPLMVDARGGNCIG
jgi:hypothetical protein